VVSTSSSNEQGDGVTNSLFSPDFQSVLDEASLHAFPSPEEWRDQPIYFLMVDRFYHPSGPPVHSPFDDPMFKSFQGGKFSGVRAALPYLRRLGVGAIWLSPVLKNLPFEGGTYHGYGIHDFLHAEPRFADDPLHADDELRAVVDAAHEAGIYVIFDIVLNHTGNVFAYPPDPADPVWQASQGAEARFHDQAQGVAWRDASGTPRFPSIEGIASPPGDALVWPSELQQDRFFRRQGEPRDQGDETVGDFASLKQMLTGDTDLQRFLIRAYQYVIARYDVDGFRIDTLRYLKGDLPRLFGNSIREFALSIGKKNFFTFGEVFDPTAEVDIARFIGRATSDQSELVGVDAALDYPLFDNLKAVVKGFAPPTALTGMYERRKEIERNVLSSHGDATRYFVTFVDNHDVKERIRYVDPADEHRFDDQVTLALACLYALPGIPCLYYGTEQGLHGRGSDEAVREALWGGPGFDEKSPFFAEISKIAAVRSEQPALRYGRSYFRPVSGDGQNFGISPFPNGIVAFSRILNDQEVLVVANTHTSGPLHVEVIVDSQLHGVNAVFRLLYSNIRSPVPPQPIRERVVGTVSVTEVDGTTGRGPLRTLPVTLQPMEAQMLRG
jgi:glycosidase